MRTKATSSDFTSEAMSTAIEAKDIGVATDKSAATVAQGATSVEAGAATTLTVTDAKNKAGTAYVAGVCSNPFAAV